MRECAYAYAYVKVFSKKQKKGTEDKGNEFVKVYKHLYFHTHTSINRTQFLI